MRNPVLLGGSGLAMATVSVGPAYSPQPTFHWSPAVPALGGFGDSFDDATGFLATAAKWTVGVGLVGLMAYVGVRVYRYAKE